MTDDKTKAGPAQGQESQAKEPEADAAGAQGGEGAMGSSRHVAGRTATTTSENRDVTDRRDGHPSPALDPVTVEACAAVAKEMREKHGSPTGDAYSNGVWDQGVRIEQKIRALIGQPAPTGNAPEPVKREMMDYLAITGIHDKREWHQIEEALQRALAKPVPSTDRLRQYARDLRRNSSGGDLTPVPPRALDALMNYQEQCDEDGAMVRVSRQALDEVLACLAPVSQTLRQGGE